MHVRRQQLVIGIFSVTVIVACSWYGVTRSDSPTSSASAPRDVTTGPQSNTTVTTTSAPTSSTISPSLGAGTPVTLAFGGDVHFEGVIKTKLNQSPSTLLSPIAPSLSSADIAVVNLETAVTSTCDPEDKDYIFATPPSTLDVLAEAGVDVVTVANNHGRDCGVVGLNETLAVRPTSPIAMIGVGANATEAYAPTIIDRNGQRVAIIGATDVVDAALAKSWTASDSQAGIASAKNEELLAQSVRDARVIADTVVVYLHYGQERQTCPNARQKEIVQILVEAGADVVVGAHAHRVQGSGYYTASGSNGRPDDAGAPFVAYGLGNFVFYATDPAGTTSGVLRLTVTGRRVDASVWEPAKIVGGVARPLAGVDATTMLDEYEQLRGCTGLSGDNT